MSTLLSELDSAPAQDGDFVQNILNEMNGGAGPTNPIQPPPAVGGFNQGVMNAPNPNTIAPRQMDAGPATAHMIGNSQPTPADFAQIMNTGPSAANQGALISALIKSSNLVPQPLLPSSALGLHVASMNSVWPPLSVFSFLSLVYPWLISCLHTISHGR